MHLIDRILSKITKNGNLTSNSIKPVIVTGLLLALVVSFLELLISEIIHGTTGFSSFGAILGVMFATMILFFTAYFIALLVIFIILDYFIKVNIVTLSISVSFFIAVIFLIPSLTDTNAVLTSCFISLVENLRTFFYLFFPIIISAIVISLILYFVNNFAKSGQKTNKNRFSLSLSFPFLAFELIIFFWLSFSYVKNFISLNFLYLLSAFLMIFLITLFLSVRVAQSSIIVKGFFTVISVILLSMILVLMIPKKPKTKAWQYGGKEHKIKHIILLSVDTLRADALSCYNEKSAPTPAIDAISEEGILFKRAISPASWTIPAFASIMTGTYPKVHKMTGAYSRLSDKLKTLAEYMRDNGYFTGAIGDNYFLSADSNNIFQGFQEFNFYPKRKGQSSDASQIIRHFRPEVFKLEATTSDLTNLALKWVEKNKKKDFFLWFHYVAPHLVYSPPEKYLPNMERPQGAKNFFADLKNVRYGTYFDGLENVRFKYTTTCRRQRRWIKGLYEGEVKYVDENIGEFINRLKELRLYKDSLIIFTSDHGEEFWDHGGFEHGHTLYNELIQVPLILKLPNSSSTGEIKKFVSTVSIMPTILNLCGIEYSEQEMSVEPLDLNIGNDNAENSFNPKPIFSSGHLFFEERESVIFDGYKYIHSLVSDKEELYDLSKDPGESFSIAAISPKLIDKAKKLIFKHNDDSKIMRKKLDLLSKKEIKINKEEKEKLSALGYME